MIFNNAEKIVDYTTYVKQINAIKFDYVLAKEELKKFHYSDSYTATVKKNFTEYLRKYKKLMVDVVSKTLKIFSGFLKECKYMVVLHGSFARNSYREFSDIDVSFVLEKKKTKNYVVFEELFYNALTHILGISRERSHSIFNRFFDYDKRQIYDNQVVIEWGDVDKKISYQVKDHSAYELFLSVNSERSYNTLLQSVSKKMTEDVLYHNVYAYEVLFNNTDNNLENDIMGIEFKNRNNFTLPKYDVKLSGLKKSYSVKDFKTVVKDIFMSELFEFASYVRHHLVRTNNYRKLLNLNEVFDARVFAEILGKNQKKLKDNYYEYLFYLTRLEICLKELGLELSSHDLTSIDLKRLLDFYHVRFKTRENIIGKLFQIIADNREVYKTTLATM